MSEGLHLLGLEARNVLRVRGVRLEFAPGGELVVIGGKNAQGKSSVLAAIEMALAGAGAVPAEPLRKGAQSGSAKVVLRDAEGRGYTVERVVTRSGTRLVVTDADGTAPRSPQAILDGLRGALAFDPLAFARLAASHRAADRQEAARILRDLVGIDFRDLDAERAAAEADRLNAGREVRTLEAQIAGMPAHLDAPAEEESAAALVAELTQAQAEIRRRRDLRDAASDAEESAAEAAMFEARRADAVEAARAALRDAEAALVAAQEETTRRRDLALEALGAAQEAENAPAPDVAALEARIATIDERNAKFRARAARTAKQQELAAARRAHDAAQERLAQAEEARIARLRAAKWPIDGLGFDDEGLVRFGAVPFEQASQAEQIRVSLAIGMALNPRLRLILVREGSALDDDALRMVASMAAERDCKVLLERVGKGEEVSVVIEDGEVSEDRRDAITEGS